jgi:hypothetical protein
MKKNIITLFMTLIFWSLILPNSYAVPKYALVIGNGAYSHGQLKNATYDAELMAETLKELGFEIVGGQALTDLSKEEMSLEIIKFGDHLRTTKGVGLFYFAGHGVQVKGRNYLIPIGAKLDREEYVKVYGVEVDEVLAQMEVAQNKMNLMVLDACRNNPFQSSYRSATRGLKMQSAPSGTLILYSTRPGMVAKDGQGKNSPFTNSLTANMKRPGLKIEEVMRETIKDVERKTRQEQTPWQEGFVREDFYFIQPKVKKAECPVGSKLVGQKCIMNSIQCPVGTMRTENNECIAAVKCPEGTAYKAGRGCVGIIEAVSANPPPPRNSVSQVASISNSNGASPRRGFTSRMFSEIPVVGYLGISAGVISHIVNFVGTSTKILDATFISTIAGYSLGGVGLSIGAYRALDTNSNKTALTTPSSSPQMMRYTVEF